MQEIRTGCVAAWWESSHGEYFSPNRSWTPGSVAVSPRNLRSWGPTRNRDACGIRQAHQCARDGESRRYPRRDAWGPWGRASGVLERHVGFLRGLEQCAKFRACCEGRTRRQANWWKVRKCTVGEEVTMGLHTFSSASRRADSKGRRGTL
jgi:hypothetical protein